MLLVIYFTNFFFRSYELTNTSYTITIITLFSTMGTKACGFPELLLHSSLPPLPLIDLPPMGG